MSRDEAIVFFELAKKLLAEYETDRLEIEPRLVLRRQANMLIVRWRLHGFTETALIGIDHGHDTPPTITSYAPGAWFYYNNWDFNALGTIYTQLTGRTYFEALRDDLARPLQMQDYDPALAGYFQKEDMSVHPAYVTRLSTRDMARIGLLMARGGEWSGKRLVSRAWVDESTKAWSTIRPGSGYGYMWWVGFSDMYQKRLRFPGPVFMAVALVSALIVASASYWLVEVPLKPVRRRFGSRVR